MVAHKNNGGSKDDDELVNLLFDKWSVRCQSAKMLLRGNVIDSYDDKLVFNAVVDHPELAS